MTRSTRLLLAASLLGVAGCDQLQPETRPGLWHPLGANAANLRAMVADPHDLDMGHGELVSPGDEAALAVIRLRADAVKRLPASSVTGVQTTDTGPADSGGGPSAAAPLSAPAGVGAGVAP